MIWPCDTGRAESAVAMRTYLYWAAHAGRDTFGALQVAAAYATMPTTTAHLVRAERVVAHRTRALDFPVRAKENNDQSQCRAARNEKVRNRVSS